jgi:hypothetical protein
MNKQELIEQCLLENPTMVQTINDVEYILSEQERIETATIWADMKIEQATEADAKAAQRQALLERLGITESEAQLLLGGN